MLRSLIDYVSTGSKPKATSSVPLSSLGSLITGSGTEFRPNEIPALNQGVRIISDTIASLPLVTKDPIVSEVMFRPNDQQSSVDFLNVIVYSLLHDANAYIEKQYGINGNLVGLVSHPYRQVSVENLGEKFRYRVTDYFGTQRVLLDSEVIHIRYQSDDQYFGRSPVRQCHEAIGLAIAMQTQGSSYYRNGARPSGTIETDKFMSTEALTRFKQDWDSQFQGVENTSKIAVLTDGYKYKNIGHNMLESDYRALYLLMSVQEVSRVLNIPPTLLNDYSHATYSNAQIAKQTLYELTLRPLMKLIESSLTHGLGMRSDTAIKFDPSELLRMSPLDQANAAKAFMESKVITANEWRAKHDLPPLTGGDAVTEVEPNETT